MPSRSLTTWQADSRRALDEIEAAHRAVGRAGPGCRYAAQQINQAYVLLLSSQFERFCRGLHSECTDHLTSDFQSATLRVIFRRQLRLGRRLDSGNPNPGNIGSDFDRFEISFWPAVVALDPHKQGAAGTARDDEPLAERRCAPGFFAFRTRGTQSAHAGRGAAVARRL